MASILFRRNRPSLPGGTPLTQFVGYGLVAVAFVVFFLSTQSEGPNLGLNESTFVDAWNEAAATAERDILAIGELQTTQDDVVGFAWTDDLLVLARLGEGEEGSRPVIELAAVGSPSRDGIDNVLAVLELVIAVADPELSAEDRTEILRELNLVARNRPVEITATFRQGTIEYRATSDPEDDEIGIGAVPLS